MLDDSHHARMIALNAISRQAEIAPHAYLLKLHPAQSTRMSDDINPGVGIERLRLAANISKKELALATGIDEGNLNRIISGKQWPTKARLKAVCDFFGVPAFEIFRISEQGATYQIQETRDPRKAQLIAAIEELTTDQLDHAFRHQHPACPKQLPNPSPMDNPSTHGSTATATGDEFIPNPRRRKA